MSSSNLQVKCARQLVKTALCKHFLQSSCSKGSKCTFAHSLDEVHEKPDLTMTSMCRTLLQTGVCDNPACKYAHDPRQLRTTASFCKTKKCNFFSRGCCKHGKSCRFSHSTEELEDDAAAGQNRHVQQDHEFDAAEGRQGGHRKDWQKQPHESQQQVQRQKRQQKEYVAEKMPPQVPPSSKAASQIGRHGSRDVTESLWWTQSTRAEKYAPGTAELIPEDQEAESDEERPGTGDSGQDKENRLMQGMNFAESGCAAAAPRSNQLPSSETSVNYTTVMLTNVPTCLTQGALVHMFEDLSACMCSTDFFYCPWDPCNQSNLGYAIVNFFTHAAADKFRSTWNDRKLLPGLRGTKRLHVCPSALQGITQILSHFSSFSIACNAEPSFRPLVRFSEGAALTHMAFDINEMHSEPFSRRTTPSDSGYSADGTPLAHMFSDVNKMQSEPFSRCTTPSDSEHSSDGTPLAQMFYDVNEMESVAVFKAFEGNTFSQRDAIPASVVVPQRFSSDQAQGGTPLQAQIESLLRCMDPDGITEKLEQRIADLEAETKLRQRIASLETALVNMSQSGCRAPQQLQQQHQQQNKLSFSGNSTGNTAMQLDNFGSMGVGQSPYGFEPAYIRKY